ncbi:NTP transferase domain-containing protein, partial [Aliarcobacter butzleri]
MKIIPFEIPCVILSGGKSSRMGEDKSLLPFG